MAEGIMDMKSSAETPSHKGFPKRLKVLKEYSLFSEGQ